MLSSLPKLADKAFIVGFFVPTLLFILAIAGLFHTSDWASAIIKAATKKDGWEELAFFVLVVWVLSLLLMVVNRIEFQILEGYLWPISKIRRFKKAEEKRYEELQARFRPLDEEWEKQREAFPTERRREWGKLREPLVKGFPIKQDDHLPTRLGNAIRAFEVYSKQIYGADSIPLWLHLCAVIPKDYQEALADARAQVNFAVNVSVLAGIFSVVACFRFLFALDWATAAKATDPVDGLAGQFTWADAAYFGSVFLAIALSRGAYLFSIERVDAWGGLVKAAFDCYLPDLASKLGYTLPETGKQRRQFWRKVSEQAIYWLRLVPEDWKPPEKEQNSDRTRNTLDEINKILLEYYSDRNAQQAKCD